MALTISVLVVLALLVVEQGQEGGLFVHGLLCNPGVGRWWHKESGFAGQQALYQD